MNQPLVSIHVITYNQKQFIHETLRSALGQDYENIEIVVADDGSTDGTAEIILDYARQYPGKIVPLVGGPNLGITGNSNRALKACRGKYIAFLGGDDVFLPQKISTQVAWFEADEKRVLCGHQVEVFYEDGRPSHLLTKRLRSGQGPKDYIRHGSLFGALSVMVRSDCVPAHGFDPTFIWVSDAMFFTEILAGEGEYGFVTGVHARYRKHASNITNQLDLCVSDFSKYFEAIRQRYPRYRNDADIGEANVHLYGLGMRSICEKKGREALGYFIKGIMKHPLGYKLWARLGQAGLMCCMK